MHIGSNDVVAERMRLVREMLARVRELTHLGVDRKVLAAVTVEVRGLAARRNLFPIEEFTPFASGMYRLSEDPDHRYALYVVAPAAGGFSPPHDHDTWAVIAGIHGREHNKFYRRLDDGSESGVAKIEPVGEIDIVAGTVISMMPENIHSIHLGEDGPHASLHLYGMSVEHCQHRSMYSRSKNTRKVFPPATGIQKARGAD